MFSDVKFICMGGSPKRMHQFALYIKDVIGHKLPAVCVVFLINLFAGHKIKLKKFIYFVRVLVFRIFLSLLIAIQCIK